MKYEFLERKTMLAEEYQRAVDVVADAVNQIGQNHVSFLVYGSFLDNRLMPGLSDIDMVLFFWHEFVIDPKLMKTLRSAFQNQFAFLRFDIGWFFDASAIDLGNAKDGRFIPQNDNFSKVFDFTSGDSKLISGKKFAHLLNPVKLIDPVEARIAYNLQTLRIYLLFGNCNNHWIGGVNPFRELKIFQLVRSLGRKVMQLIEPDNFELIKDKKAAFDELKRQMPKIDFSALDEIESLFRERNNVVDEIIGLKTSDLLFDSLECYERVVQRIVANFPPRSLREKGKQ